MKHRLSVVESDVKDIKTVLARMEPKLSEMHTFMQATLPHLATKAEVSQMRADLTRDIGDLKVTLAERPSKTYMWTIVGVLAAAILAAAALT